MRTVLSHPLGPIPWALAASDGTQRKTNKATLGNALEKLAAPVDVIPDNSACIIDGMSVVQKLKGNPRTFDELSNAFLIQQNTIRARPK